MKSYKYIIKASIWLVIVRQARVYFPFKSVKFYFNPSYDGIFPIETYNQVIGYEVAWYYA
jgi:hypothetical protein